MKKEQRGLEGQVDTPVASAPKPVQALSGRPTTAGKDRIGRWDIALPTDSDESSYELSAGMGRHATAGTDGAKNARVRPGPSGSTASLNPLLEAGLQPA